DGAIEGQHARLRGRCRSRGCCLGTRVHVSGPLNRPPRRPLSAVDAAQKDTAGFTPHAVFVTSRQITIEPVPHDKPPVAGSLGAHPMARVMPPCLTPFAQMRTTP